MAKSKVSPGQVWREDSSQQQFLVTRVYSELFDQYAILRPVDGEETRRLKLSSGEHPLPGFTQESGEFIDESAGEPQRGEP